MGKRGPYTVKGEIESEKYPGYLVNPAGRYRKSCYRPNKGGTPKLYSRYFFEVSCGVCGRLHLKDDANMAHKRKRGRDEREIAAHVYTCSKECTIKRMTSDDGHTRRKRGRTEDTHIMERATDHPHAKKGFVPQHRLVVERSLGRFLDPKELVHHINCVKSDNRIENLDVFQNGRDHFLSHGSLNQCVAALIEAGHLLYNRETQRYETNL